ncbi:response regulator [Pseudarthrobacter sp. P1]|uniref:response regulator n=1 Tax=Pseudarthrobacter sp. P1 TaxID=3418418 RepID=UPI003CF75054
MLAGDAGRIRQVLLNLASNAIKFTESGEVIIRVHLLDGDAGRAIVRFDVRDTGIGIDPADHGRLFESFSQADASTTRKYGGTGLGLAISRRLTEAMGGEIGVASGVGEGSTFWFWLALAPAHGTEAVATLDPLAGLRVLVVDDNATNRLVLQSQLTSWRMAPEVVEDAPTALQLCRAAAAGRPFDIAVLDMCMPEMDGLELAQAITADPALAATALIMLTSSSRVDGVELAAAGIREWLTKPVRSSEFYDRLMRLMSGTARPAAMVRTIPDRAGQPSRGRVLIVEDNEVNQLVAREMVSKLGYRVEVVANGFDAVAATGTAHFDAILMDCHMPVMDGFEATRAIRARDGPTGRLPIIAMTAGALDEDRQRCLAAGMDDYLAKPVDYSALDATLARWVGGTPSGPSEAAAVDPARLEVLRSLGPADGLGLLPAAAEAFRSDVPGSLATLRDALAGGQGDVLARAAHKLKGAAANIGAAAAASICAELESLEHGAHPGSGTDLLDRLEAELGRVDTALELAMAVAP